MQFVAYATVPILAYALGSIPTGYWVGLARGIDIRKAGSGNIGATNVFRVLGKPAGIFVLIVDALKGYLACTVVARLGSYLAAAQLDAMLREQLSILGGIAAILGHNYSCWMRFQGGKGIATSAGVLLAAVPLGLLVSLGTWIAVFALSRYVSLASLSAAFILPWGVWLTGGSNLLIGVTAFMGALAIYKHRGNIQRLRLGTEPRFGQKKPETPASTQS